MAAIDLEKLVAGMPGLTPRMGASMAEAAGVCFEAEGHSTPTDLTLSVDETGTHEVSWKVPDDQTRRAWADESYATEQGAYAVAIGIATEVRGLVALERSRKFNGFDYWMGTNEKTLFSDKTRLEVSGIRNGSTSQLKTRTAQKVAQIDGSASPLKGLVVVVEFGEARAHVVDR